MLVGETLDKSFLLQRQQFINDGLVRRDAAPFLNLPNEGGVLLSMDVLLDELEDGELFSGECASRQWLTVLGNATYVARRLLFYRVSNITIFCKARAIHFFSGEDP